MFPVHFQLLSFLLFFFVPSTLSAHMLMPLQHGELCNWRSPTETCDELKGLVCQRSQRCSCWDIRTIFSPEKNRCVGKAGEECYLFGGERLCTENAYCLEDASLSSLPICLCLKGYFKRGDGVCARYGQYGDRCDPPNTHSSSSSCEPESGLQCINHVCQCDVNQIYDKEKKMCLSTPGMPCSKTLNNCVENSNCVEKVYGLDYNSGRTKMIGFKCKCKPGFKMTDDGQCGVEFGGSCSLSADCLSRESLTCINGMCQCDPLSQVYDRRVRRCLNLAGSRCKIPSKKEDRHSSVQEEQQDVERKLDSIGKPQTLPSTTTTTITTTTTAASRTSSEATKSTTTRTTTVASAATTKPISTSGTTLLSSETTEIPISIISSRNLSSRNFKFHLNPYHRASPRLHFIAPRYYDSSLEIQQEYTDLYPEHRADFSSEAIASISAECIQNAECMQKAESSTDYICMCQKGTSETVMRTCLLEYGEVCMKKEMYLEKDRGEMQESSSLQCDIFKGLVCKEKKCVCADPMLRYDNETRSCLSSVGSPCGKMRLNSKLINSVNYHHDKVSGDKSAEDFSNIPPFSVYQTEPTFYLNCEADAVCAENKSGNGQFKQICVPRGKFPTNRFGVGFAS